MRELRELVRYRAKLVALRSGLKAQVHAVLAKERIIPRLDDAFGPTGQVFLDQVPLERDYAIRVESLRDLIEIYDREVDMLEPEIYRWLRGDAGYHAIQAIHGVGRTMAAIFVAEIGDISRSPTARHLCSCAGLTPKHIESDTKVIRGRITRMGSALVRWAATEAVVRYQGGAAIRPAYARIAARRATRSPGWRRPENSSASSSTACAMAASLPAGGGVTVRHSPGASSPNGVTPTEVAWSST